MGRDYLAEAQRQGPKDRKSSHEPVHDRQGGINSALRLTGAPLPPYAESVEVELTSDQKAFVRQAIDSGRLRCEEEAVREALSMWEERERARVEILAAVDAAEASLARGEGRAITTPEEVKQLADDVKRRGIARLNAEKNSRA